MEPSLHDTIDVKDEVEATDELVAVEPSPDLDQPRPSRFVATLLVGIANGIWAVVGLVLWLPQAVRAVLGAALRTIHGALTQQASGRAIAGIERVSRSYVDRFLDSRRQPSLVGRRQELRALRLAGETSWAVLFYLVVLRWLAPERFALIWRWLLGLAEGAKGRIGGAARQLAELSSFDLAQFEPSSLQVGGVLFVASLAGMILGIWLGRRGR